MNDFWKINRVPKWVDDFEGNEFFVVHRISRKGKVI